MGFQVILITMLIWVLTLIANVFMIRMLEGRNLRFAELVEKELLTLIFLCLFSPVVFIFMILVVILKFSITAANLIPEEKQGKACKNCMNCGYRCDNECLFFKLTIKPRMMCKGRFFVFQNRCSQ